MTKGLISPAIIATSLIFSSVAFANGNTQPTDHQKHWSVGVGSYAFSIANDSNSRSDLDFSGFNLTAGYALNNHFQVRGTYFSLENDDYGSIKSKGYELMAYGGVGFAKSGFRGYGGAGFFADEWSASSYSESISGIQFGGGLGYNWGPVALDFVLTLREAGQYERFMFDPGTYVAMSGNLSLSYLF